MEDPPPQGSEAHAGGQPGEHPSAYGGGTNMPMTPSMAPPPPPKKQGGGIINKPKFPGVGVQDIVGNKMLLKQLLGEFLGTALLVFFGIGSVITASYIKYHPEFLWKGMEKCLLGLPNGCENKNEPNRTYATFEGGTSNLHVSFGFGIAVASIAQAIGHISGCHLNPAVSVGLVAAGECSIIKAGVYSVTQIVGAIFGAGILKLCTWSIVSPEPRIQSGPGSGTRARFMISTVFQIEEGYANAADEFIKKGKDPKNFPVFDPEKHLVGWSLGVSTLKPEVSVVQGIVIEMILTMILVLVVCGVCDSLRKDVKGSATLAIGFAVFLCHVVGINFTGSSVNPARSIGPLPFVNKQAAPTMNEDIIVYIVGPMLGGILAGLLYNIFFRAPSEEPAKVSPETQA